MLLKFLDQLCVELDIAPAPKMDEKKVIHFQIGMSLDEKDLTLSLGMPYEMTYRVFRESLEDFVNFILHWRKEVETFEKLEPLL